MSTWLGELIDERLGLAYRLACEHTELSAQRRWGLVVELLAQGLEEAVRLSDEESESEASAELGPCLTCGGHTHLHVHGQAWHYSCWMQTGAPDETESATLKTPESGTTGDTGSVAPPESDTDATDQSDGARTAEVVAQPGTAAHSPDRGGRFELDPAQELHDWSREVRSVIPDATDEQCQESLAAWHAAVVSQGEPARFVSSPGYTGVAVYEWLSQRHSSMTRPQALQSEEVWQLSESRTTKRVFSFLDQEQTPEISQSVTEVDVNAQYLAAARSTELGDGEPLFLDEVKPAWRERLFKQPGYVQLATTPDVASLPKPARLAFADLDAEWWLPNPAARFLQHDHGLDLDIGQAYVWKRGSYGRRLSVWAALFADARATLAEQARFGDEASGIALGVLKTVYATFLGGMTRSKKHNDRGTLRPDWHDQYVTQAEMNALRALGKVTDATPLGGMKDAFWFLSSAEDAPIQPAGLTYSDQPGKWHLNRWGAVDTDIVQAHHDGRIGTLRKAITQADQARQANEEQ